MYTVPWALRILGGHAKHLKDTYCLYVVWDPTMPEWQLQRVKNPAACLAMDAKEVAVVSRYRIPAEAVERAAEQQEKAR